MPVVYGLTYSPPTRSVIMTAKMIGLDFTLRPVEVFQEEHMTEEYLKIAPTHTIPVFEENDGFRIIDSHAIVTYIVGKYAKNDSLYPKDLKKRAAVDSMLHFDNGSVWSSFLFHFARHMLFVRPYDPELEAAFKDKMSVLNRILGSRPYAAGDQLTVADICLVNTFSTPLTVDFDFSDYPNITKWLNKIKKEIKGYDEIVKAGSEEFQQGRAMLKAKLSSK